MLYQSKDFYLHVHCFHNLLLNSPLYLYKTQLDTLIPSKTPTFYCICPPSFYYSPIFPLYIWFLESSRVTRHLWSSHKKPGGISTACRLVVLWAQLCWGRILPRFVAFVRGGQSETSENRWNYIWRWRKREKVGSWVGIASWLSCSKCHWKKLCYKTTLVS